MQQAPWSDVGRLQNEVREIKSQINQMPRSCEIQQISGDVGSLEHTVREVRASCDGLRHELETLREEVRQLREDLIPSVT